MLQIREALFLASTPALVGVPMLGRQLLALLGDTPPGPLADKLTFNEKVYILQTNQAAQRVTEVAAELQRQQLVVPSPPVDDQSYVAWRDGVTRAVLGAVAPGTPASLAVFIGIGLGEVLLTEHLLGTVLSLLTVAPEHAALVQQAQELAARHTKATAQLAQLVALPLATPALRRIGGELVAALGTMPDLSPHAVDAARAAAVREHQGQIESIRQSLLTAAAAEAPPELLVPPFLLGYLPTAAGVAFQCLDLLLQLESSAPPELLQRSRELADSLRASNRQTVADVLAVESLLQHAKLAVPPRPQSTADYFAWLAQIRKAVPTTVQPMSPAGSVVSLGFFLADLLVTLRVDITALTLLQTAPQYPHLLAQRAASAQGVASDRQNLDQALRHPALPEPARAIGRRLAEQVAQAVTLATTLPAATHLNALTAATAAIEKGKDEIVAVLIAAQKTPGAGN